MSLESELSKLRHPSNSKNFPILGSVPPSHDFKFPMVDFLANDLDSYKGVDKIDAPEYADDDIAHEIPGYYPEVARIIFSDYPFDKKIHALEAYAFMVYVIPPHEMDFFRKVIGALSDRKIAEEGRGVADGAKLPSPGVNKATNTGIYAKRKGGSLGIWGGLLGLFKPERN